MVSKPVNKNRNKTNRLGGRPEHEYSERIAGRLESAIKFGIPQEELAADIGLSLNTLKKHYSDIFECCKENRHQSVKRALHYQATVLNIPSSTIFYLKTQCEEFQEKGADGTDSEVLMQFIATQLKDRV